MKRIWLVVLATMIGCGELTAPDGAVPIRPLPTIYRQWWAELEACSGFRGDLDAINFFVTPHMEPADRVGYTHRRPGSAPMIVFRAGWEDREWIVKHEMMHVLGNFTTHPPEYFKGRCGDLRPGH